MERLIIQFSPSCLVWKKIGRITYSDPVINGL